MSRFKHIKSKVETALTVPTWLMVILVIIFLLWMFASSVVMWKAQYAISHTTLMCTDRLINEMDIRVAMKNELESLRRANLIMSGKVKSYERMLDIAHDNYDKNYGGEN